MSEITNIKIITSLGELTYRSTESLGISFNRIVDDFQQIDNRFQDFSYDFELPYVKQNSIVFGTPEAKGSKNYFNKNKNIGCQVYLNNQLLLDGIINLEGITKTGYKCKFYSKFKELIDKLNEPNPDGTDKTLRDLQFTPVSGWSYEESVITHIAANYKDCTETFYQYPLSHYSTFYTEYSLYSGLTENLSRPPYVLPFRIDYAPQNFYYFINSNLTGRTGYNRIYIHQIPPAVYIVSILEQILSDAGWKLGGQFFNDKDIRRILLLYAGDEDIYDQATGHISGSTDMTLQIAKFLPDTQQSEFLKDIINYFNLYIKVDVPNRIVNFETYNVIFGDSFNPYDITDKVNVDTLEFYNEQNNDPSIIFEKANNQNIMGDNKVMSNSTDNATTQLWSKVSKSNYNSFFNKIGTTDEIKLGFSEPNVQRIFIWNDIDKNGATKMAGTQTIYLPCLTKQTPTDNENKKFAGSTGDTYIFNNEQTIKFAGKGSLMYYYGRSTTEFENKAGKGYLGNFMYFNMYTDTGMTINRVPINICSPMQLFNYRDKVEAWLNNVNVNNYEDRRTTTCTYLQTIWQLMGQNQNLSQDITTEFSLVFDDSEYHETLWSKFHKNKYDKYKNSEMLKATMRMNVVDWQEMQIERPILFNNEIYNIVQIEGYNPISKNGEITLIKR
jgi:hypothetical protein